MFPKQLLADSLELKYKREFNNVHPWETAYVEGDKTPFEQIIMNFYSFFDLKSQELKSLKQKVKFEAVDLCFNKIDLNSYPNEDKINHCIKNIENKYLGKFYNKRNIFFGNSIIFNLINSC